MLELLKKYDWGIFIAVLLLVCLGMILIYSATLGEDTPDFSKTVKQGVFLGAGVIIMFAVSLIDYRLFSNYSWLVYVVMLVLLVTVMFWGVALRGTRAWFDLGGGLHLQPSELAKIGLVLILAKYFSQHHGNKFSTKHFIISGIYAVIPIGLVILQNDFGTASLLMLIWGGMVLVAGLRWFQALALSMLVLVLGWGAWRFVLQKYQKDRVRAFLNPELDPLGSGYNVAQAKIAIGSGGWFGKGLGHGSQSQLNFLPEQHTDFIFAVLGEELGWAGCFFMLSIFSYIFYRLYAIQKQVREVFGKFIVMGVGIMLISQIFFNIAGNLGLLPVTGVPLPLVSYGGSSLITIFVGFGVIQNIVIRSRKAYLTEAKLGVF